MPVPLITAVLPTLGLAGPPIAASRGALPRPGFTDGEVGSLFADNATGRVEAFPVFFATKPLLAVATGLFNPAGCCTIAFPDETLFGLFAPGFCPEVRLVFGL